MKESKKTPPLVIVRPESDLLAYQRTILAQERTLMAWVRTSLSMISFGFTIYKFFTDLNKDDLTSDSNGEAAQNFGLSLVILGTIFLIAASIQHHQVLNDLHIPELKKRLSLPFIAAILISALGVIILIGIFLHLGPLN
ncbi:MAG: DUF202 domain-containing protein [bacterium]|nr:DUF202 domain-containing protein [bacterium]